MAWSGDSNLSFGVNDIRELLRPRDFPGLLAARDYKQQRWYSEFYTEMFARAGFYIRYDDGTVINLVPAYRGGARARGSKIFRDRGSIPAERDGCASTRTIF